MEYLHYALVVVALLAVCLVGLLQARRREPVTRKQKSAAAQAERLPNHHAILQRELRQVPTPWGWPGSDSHARLNGSAQHRSLNEWVDWLISEKRTVDDDDYLARRNASVRALIEDRYGRVVEPTRQVYEKVKPPRLRDPAAPHDQMDNFPSGKADRIVSGLTRQPGKPLATGLRRGQQPALREVRTPWGW